MKALDQVRAGNPDALEGAHVIEFRLGVHRGISEAEFYIGRRIGRDLCKTDTRLTMLGIAMIIIVVTINIIMLQSLLIILLLLMALLLLSAASSLLLSSIIIIMT